MFFLLYKRISDDGVFDDFPKISDHFPKISQKFPKLFRRPDERSRTFCENLRKFPKMSEDSGEDCRRLSRKTRRCFDDTPTNLSIIFYNFDVSEIIDIFICEDIISSHVRISYRFYQFVTTRYTTEFYIIKLNILEEGSHIKLQVWLGRVANSVIYFNILAFNLSKNWLTHVCKNSPK